MKINRCPKCGREVNAIRLVSLSKKTIGFVVECYDCNLRTNTHKHIDEAVEQWNYITTNFVWSKTKGENK